MTTKTTITGLPDLRDSLRTLAPKLRQRALRNALAAGGRLVQRAARAAAPVLDRSNPYSAQALQDGRRNVGTVQKAISVRTSKLARRNGDVGVFVNVRPAKRGQRGRNSPNDPFYWRWLNWGWNPATSAHGLGQVGKRHRRRLVQQGAAKARRGAYFLEAGAAKLSEALAAFTKAIGPQIARMNKPKAPAP